MNLSSVKRAMRWEMESGLAGMQQSARPHGEWLNDLLL